MIEWIFLAIIALLQLADGVTTWKILSLGGIELNPAQKWLMDHLGVRLSLVVTKCMLVGGAAVVACFAAQYSMLKVLLYLLVVVFMYICVNNVQVWKNLKR